MLLDKSVFHIYPEFLKILPKSDKVTYEESLLITFHLKEK